MESSSALSIKLDLEKRLGIMAVIPLSGGSINDFATMQNFLLSVSPVTITRARQYLRRKINKRDKPEYKLVGLVTQEPLLSDEIHEWELASQGLAKEEEIIVDKFVLQRPEFQDDSDQASKTLLTIIATDQCLEGIPEDQVGKYIQNLRGWTQERKTA